MKSLKKWTFIHRSEPCPDQKPAICSNLAGPSVEYDNEITECDFQKLFEKKTLPVSSESVIETVEKPNDQNLLPFEGNASEKSDGSTPMIVEFEGIKPKDSKRAQEVEQWIKNCERQAQMLTWSIR